MAARYTHNGCWRHLLSSRLMWVLQEVQFCIHVTGSRMFSPMKLHACKGFCILYFYSKILEEKCFVFVLDCVHRTIFFSFDSTRKSDFIAMPLSSELYSFEHSSKYTATLLSVERSSVLVKLVDMCAPIIRQRRSPSAIKKTLTPLHIP